MSQIAIFLCSVNKRHIRYLIYITNYLIYERHTRICETNSYESVTITLLRIHSFLSKNRSITLNMNYCKTYKNFFLCIQNCFLLAANILDNMYKIILNTVDIGFK